MQELATTAVAARFSVSVGGHAQAHLKVDGAALSTALLHWHRAL
jgi:hypothetical protein